MKIPHTVSQKTFYRSLLVVAILIGCVVDRTSILDYQAQLDEKKSVVLAKRDFTNQVELESLRLKTESDVAAQKLETQSSFALKRASQGCVTIKSTRNNKPIRLDENVRVFDPESFPNDPKTPRYDKQGNPINGVRFMPPGLVVCNQFGDTAVVGSGGVIGQVYRVTPSKLPEFQALITPNKTNEQQLSNR